MMGLQNVRRVQASVSRAAAGALILGLTAVTFAQSVPPTVSSMRANFSTAKPGDEQQVGTLTCYATGSKATTWPIKLKWVAFNTVAFRMPGTNAVYRDIATFSKTGEKVTGDHITMEVQGTALQPIVWIDWQMGNEAKWNSRQIPVRFSLGCNGLK